MLTAEARVAEPEVVIAVNEWLIKRNVLPYCFSIARGSGIDNRAARDRLETLYAKTGFRPSFVSSGPDVLATSDEEEWAVECKGSGEGKGPTHRNNFDRALASTVSYYGYKGLGQSACSHLGLALPTTRAYLRQLRERVKRPLRARLNLWLLLYDPAECRIHAVPPDMDP